MSYGLEIRTTNGNIAFTTDDNLMTYYGQGTFVITNNSSTSPSVTVSGLLNNSLFHVYVVDNVYGQNVLGVVTKANGSFTFQRQTSSGSAYTTGTMTYFYTVIKTS